MSYRLKNIITIIISTNTTNMRIMCVCMYVCMNVSMYVCVYIYIFYLFIYIGIHTYAHKPLHMSFCMSKARIVYEAKMTFLIMLWCVIILDARIC